MNKATKLLMFLVVMATFTTSAWAQDPDTVSVTFTVNMSTVQDTVNAEDYSMWINGNMKGQFAEVDGRATFVDGESLGWDAGATATMTNIGGDYWQATYRMFKGDTVLYKFRYKNNVSNGEDDENAFLEASNPAGWDTRGFVAVSDTVLPVAYYNERDDKPTPGTLAPFTSAEDSVTVYFRVNVGGQVQTEDLDPETGKVGVRGAPPFFDNPGDWSSSAFHLENLGGSGDNLFYGGSTKVHKDSVANFTEPVPYKFVIEDGDGTVTWESDPNNTVVVPSSDSTAYWRFFNDTPPSNAVIVETNLNFEVNVGILEGIGFFNSAIDTVFVTGTFNGWNNSQNQMNFNNITGNYTTANGIPFTAAVESEVSYKYFIKWDSRRDSVNSDFYLEGITHDGSGWEEPGVTGGGNRVFTIEDLASQPVRSESYNSVAPQALITPANVEGGGPMVVTFSVDMTNAANRTDGTTAFNAASDSVFLIIDTPFFALTNDIIVSDGDFATRSLEQRDKVMFTDPNEDMIYTLDLTLAAITINNIGFRIAYGEPTSENGELVVNGGGFDAGRRHYQYIQPIITEDGPDLDNLPDVSWPATFAMPTLPYEASDVSWEQPLDYSVITSNELGSEVADRFVLEQNYPNPFNPSTNISFNLPQASTVKLTVYNVLGQEVATLLDNRTLNSGVHKVAFDASALSSGMYIYRLEAGSFTSTKRMMLIK